MENTEIGMRSDLADGKVRFNATVFDTDWADLQAAGVVTDPVTGVQIPTLLTTNVGTAKAKGVEIELTFLPIASLQINVGLGILDTAYTEIEPGTYSGHLPFTTGLEFADAPDTSYTLGLQHTAILSGGGDLRSRVSTTTTRVSSGGRSRSCVSPATRPCLMATRRAVTGVS